MISCPSAPATSPGPSLSSLVNGDAAPHYSFWFVVVAAIFTTCLITSNIIAVKIIRVFGLILPAAVIIFPISYIFGDVLTEVYGYGRARQVIWLAFVSNLVAVAAIWVGQVLPPAPFWKAQGAYEAVLGHTPRILAASFLAYLIGEFANSFVLARMKILTRGRWLWTRTIGSTIIGQGLDSAVFMTAAFTGIIPVEQLFAAAIAQWLVKSGFEALATPLTYMAVKFLKRLDRSDVYDYGTRFNPLIIGR
jgi:queuosine precursor transporter